MKHRNIIYYVVAPVSVALSTLFAMSLQPIIDFGLEKQMDQFIWAVVISIVLCLLDIVFGYLIEYFIMAGKADYVKQLRKLWMNRILQSRYDEYCKKEDAYYTALLTTNAEQIGQKYYENIMKIYRYVFSLVISVIAIGYAGWEIMVYVIVFSVLSVYLPKFFQTQSIGAEQKYATLSNEHVTFVQETFQNFIPIRVFRLWKKRCRIYGQKCEELAGADCHRNSKTFMLNSVAAGIGELSYVMIIIFAMILVIRGKMTVGYIMSVSQILGGIMFPFEILPGCILEYKSGRILKETIEKEIGSNVIDKETEVQMEKAPAFLEVQSASFAYGETEVLHRVSFRFELSKKYAIIGKSGSGKSTLAKGICGLMVSAEGRCMLDQTDIKNISSDELFCYLIYQQQSAELFSGTIEDNIDLKGQMSKKEISWLAEKMHIDYLIREEQNVQEVKSVFSGGEIQRILLARAFASDAKMLVLDECFSALDNENAKKIEENILKQTDKGIVMITHRIFEENMRMYDCVLVVENGTIAKSGTWDELSHDDKVLQLIAHN